MYKEWADGQVAKMTDILNSARDSHTDVVKTRIESVKQMGGVVDITKQLFAVSKVRQQNHGDGAFVVNFFRKLLN